jgi:ABC-type branched-subunit amino acid transport system permease subunit
VTSGEVPATKPGAIGFAARLAAVHPGCGWGAGFLGLVLLPLAILNGYQQYLLDLIMINIVLAVGLNIVKGFAGQAMLH